MSHTNVQDGLDSLCGRAGTLVRSVELVTAVDARSAMGDGGRERWDKLGDRDRAECVCVQLCVCDEMRDDPTQWTRSDKM